MNEQAKEFANRLKIARKKRGVTQDEMAERLGVTRPTVYRMEAGLVEVTRGRLEKVAEILDMTTDELLGLLPTEGRVPVLYHATAEDEWHHAVDPGDLKYLELQAAQQVTGPNTFAVLIVGPGMTEELPVGSHAICEPADVASDVGSLYLLEETTEQGKRWSLKFLAFDAKTQALWLVPPDPAPRFQPLKLTSDFKPVGIVTFKIIPQRRQPSLPSE